MYRFTDRFISVRGIKKKKTQTKILVLSFLWVLLLMDYSGESRLLMECREATLWAEATFSRYEIACHLRLRKCSLCLQGTGRLSLSTKVLLIFLYFSYFLIKSFLFFLFSQSRVCYFPILLSNHATGHPDKTFLCICPE